MIHQLQSLFYFTGHKETHGLKKTLEWIRRSLLWCVLQYKFCGNEGNAGQPYNFTLVLVKFMHRSVNLIENAISQSHLVNQNTVTYESLNHLVVPVRCFSFTHILVPNLLYFWDLLRIPAHYLLTLWFKSIFNDLLIEMKGRQQWLVLVLLVVEGGKRPDNKMRINK